jgi:hypothetical protein
MGIIKNLFGCKPAKSEVSALKDLCVVKNTSFPCDRCLFSDQNCKKLHFANQTVCVCKKEEFENYEVKPKKNKK